MKKFFIITGLLLTSLDIFAQLEKGMIAVGITSAFKSEKRTNEYTYTNVAQGFYYYTNNTIKSSSFNVAPSASYFISKRFALGIQIGYIGYTTTNDITYKYHSPEQMNVSQDKSSSVGFDINPFVKYYIPLSENIFFYIKGSVGFTSSKGKLSGYTEGTTYDAFGNGTTTRISEYGPNNTKTTVTYIGISPGLLYMPIKKIGIEFTLGNLLGVSSSNNTSTDSNGNSSKATSSGFEYFNFNTLSVGTGIYYFFK